MFFKEGKDSSLIFVFVSLSLRVSYSLLIYIVYMRHDCDMILLNKFSNMCDAKLKIMYQKFFSHLQKMKNSRFVIFCPN